MRVALGLLYHLESAGCQLIVEGDSIRFRARAGVLNDSLKELVTTHKLNLVKMLEARRKSGYREASLFPLIGQSVVTPKGSGELLSVFREYCRVQLHRTGEVLLIEPRALISLTVSEFLEELAA